MIHIFDRAYELWQTIEMQVIVLLFEIVPHFFSHLKLFINKKSFDFIQNHQMMENEYLNKKLR